MATAHKETYSPVSFQELFSLWSRFPNAVPYAGGTSFLLDNKTWFPVLPDIILSLDNIKELKRISRTERYLEIGSMVSLNTIFNLGKIVPEIFIKTIENIAGLHIRNMATLGGSICDKRKLDTIAPLIALDAHFELRNSHSSRWVSAARFFSTSSPALSSAEIVTRIRIPLEQWNLSIYRKFKIPGRSSYGNIIVFMLKNTKDIITDLRVAYSGSIILDNRQSRTHLIGKRLPLKNTEAQVFYDDWKKYLVNMESMMNPAEKILNKTINEIIHFQILNFIEYIIMDLTD